MFALICRRMAARSTGSLLGRSVGAVGEGLGGERDGSGCRGGSGIVVVGVGSGKSRSRFAMFALICRQMAARSTGSLLGRSVGAVGEGLGGERDGSGCRGGSGIVVVGGGKSRSKFAMFARIWRRMAARSTGSLLGGVAVGVGEGLGGRGDGSGCRGVSGIVVVVVDGGKSRSKFAMFARIWRRMAARSTGSLFDGAEVGWLGVASSMGEMLLEVVGRGSGAGEVFHSDAAVGQKPLQNANGHWQMIGEKPSSGS